MTTTCHIGLEKLILRYPRAKLRGIVATRLTLTGLEDALPKHASIDLSALKRIWIRSDRELRLIISISFDDKPLEASDMARLEDTLFEAKMWQQLGLRALPVAPHEKRIQPDVGSILRVGLQHNDQNEGRHASSIYDLCHRIPPGDVVPPAEVPTATLNIVEMTLNVNRQKAYSWSGKRKRTEVDMLGENDEDDLLLTQPDEDLTDIGALVAMIDAALRLNIVGEPKTSRATLADGLTARFLDDPKSLLSIAPTVFDPNYLKATSMRAVLLPTIAHALSQSLTTQARSATLKSKARELFVANPRDREGQTEEGMDIPKNNLPRAAKQFNLASAHIWMIMQRQLARDQTIPRLSPLISQPTSIDGVEDEDLFASQISKDPLLDFEFDDEMFEDAWFEEDDELLFGEEDIHGEKVNDDEILFENLFCSPSSPNLFSSDALVDDNDNDLLLDLMLDEGRSDE